MLGEGPQSLQKSEKFFFKVLTDCKKGIKMSMETEYGNDKRSLQMSFNKKPDLFPEKPSKALSSLMSLVWI